MGVSMGALKLTYYHGLEGLEKKSTSFLRVVEKNTPVSKNRVNSYRFAFNGMEQDQEVSGSGNSYTTQFRQYDPRLGRWKSLDPLMHMFASVSPYIGFGDNPILFTDPYGLAPTNNGKGKSSSSDGGGTHQEGGSDPNLPEGGEQGDVHTWTSDNGITHHYVYVEDVGWIPNGMDGNALNEVQVYAGKHDQISGDGVTNVIVVHGNYKDGTGVDPNDVNYRRYLKLKEMVESNDSWEMVYANNKEDVIQYLDDLNSTRDKTHVYFSSHGSKDFFKIGSTAEGNGYQNRVSGDRTNGYNLDEYNEFWNDLGERAKLVCIAACWVGELDEDGGHDFLEQIQKESGMIVLASQNNNISSNLGTDKSMSNLAGHDNGDWPFMDITSSVILSAGMYTVVFEYNGQAVTVSVPGLVVDADGNVRTDSSQRMKMFKYFYENDPKFKAYIDTIIGQ